MVHFVGAGPGAADLITVRGQELLRSADAVIYAGSLVNPELVMDCREDCVLYNSASMTLEEITDVMIGADKVGKTVVRLHTGDPSLYGAIREQMAVLDEHGIEYDVTPGVSSFSGAAASLMTELTLPNVAQTVIITRTEGRTAMPEKEKLRDLAVHQTTMVLFLSSALSAKVKEELIEGGYPPETPVAVVYWATWPDERIVRTTLDELPEVFAKNGLAASIIIVGKVLAEGNDFYEKSRLYAADFSTGYREAKEP